MIKLFEKYETEKYTIIKILFIKITFKKKSPKSDIDTIVWYIPIKKLRNSIRIILYKLCNIESKIEDLNIKIESLFIIKELLLKYSKLFILYNVCKYITSQLKLKILIKLLPFNINFILYNVD